MTARKDGGPAFACAAENGHQEGLSRRDYFAAAALPAVVASATAHPQMFASAEAMNSSITKTTFAIADAMLAESEKGGEG